MGIIQQQTIKGTVYTYIGAFIGLINTAILFPKILSTSEIGLISLLVSYSVIFSQFATLGFTSITTRMFSYFRNEKNKHHGFLFILLVVGLAGFLLSMIIFFMLKPYVIKDSVEKSALLIKYMGYLIPLIFFTLFFVLFDDYYKVLYNTIIGTFLKEIIQRLLLLISVLLYSFNIFELSQFVFAYVISLSLPTIFILIALMYKKQFSIKPDFSLLTKEMRQTMIKVGFFGILSSFAGMLVLNIDRIMINSILGISLTGVYTIAFFFGTIILMPNRSLIKISSVIIADAWKKNDLEEIKLVYQKSCLNQLIIAVLLFIGIWGNIDNIFKILPAGYETGRYVIFFIAVSGVIKMATGTSDVIISISKYYKNMSYLMLIHLFCIIATNYLFIPVYGITGAAFASTISIFIFALLRFAFLFYKFRFQPYNYKYLLVLFSAVIAYLVSTLIPIFSFFVLDIVIRSIVMVVIFSSIILIFKVSDEANAIFNQILKTRKFNK